MHTLRQPWSMYILKDLNFFIKQTILNKFCFSLVHEPITRNIVEI